MRRRLAYVALASLPALALASCQEVPTSSSGDPPLFEIKDALHNEGNEHFFWLPPMVGNPASFNGDFDGGLSPIVRICDLADCENAVITEFSTTTGPGSETVRVVPDEEHYIVNWHTSDLDVSPGPTYRISVFADATTPALGYADVELGATGKDVKNLATLEIIGLLDGRTLPIKFRIEEGALGGAGLVNVTLGKAHTCALATDGTGWCWGYGNFGQLGDGNNSYTQATPASVAFDGRFASLTAGENHTCGVATDGTAWCWGNGTYGQLGDGSTTVTQTTPVQVNLDGQFVSLTSSFRHTCGPRTDGTWWCWGAGEHGQLGDGSTTAKQTTPVQVVFDGQLLSLTAGGLHTCGLTTDGQAWCWGYGEYGQLGDGSTTLTQTTPVQVAFDGQFVSLIAGITYTCGVATDGTAWCWGQGRMGQLGDGTTTPVQTTPVQVVFDGQFVSLAAQWFHTCGLATDGTWWCWGGGEYGQLGDGSTTVTQTTPVQVVFDGQFVSLANGQNHTCGVATDGTAWCWGRADNGRLGDGSTTPNKTTPVQVLYPPPPSP